MRGHYRLFGSSWMPVVMVTTGIESRLTEIASRKDMSDISRFGQRLL